MSKAEKKEVAAAEPPEVNLKPSIADAIAALESFKEQGQVTTIIEQFRSLGENNEKPLEIETKASKPPQSPVEILRINLNKLLESTEKGAISGPGAELRRSLFGKVIHLSLLALAYYQPINSEDIFLQPFNPERSVAASNGQQFDLLQLRAHHNARDCRQGENVNDKQLLNPLNNEPFSARDTNHIVIVANANFVFFRGLQERVSKEISYRRLEECLAEAKLEFKSIKPVIDAQLQLQLSSIPQKPNQEKREVQYLSNLAVALSCLQKIGQLDQSLLNKLLQKFHYVEIGLMETLFYFARANPQNLPKFELLVDGIAPDYLSLQTSGLNTLNNMFFVFRKTQSFFVEKGFDYALTLMKDKPENWRWLSCRCENFLTGKMDFSESDILALFIMAKFIKYEVAKKRYCFEFGAGSLFKNLEETESCYKELSSLLAKIKERGLFDILSFADLERLVPIWIEEECMDEIEELLEHMRKSDIAITKSHFESLFIDNQELLPRSLDSLNAVIKRATEELKRPLNVSEFEVLFDHVGAGITFEERPGIFLASFLEILILRKTLDIKPNQHFNRILTAQSFWLDEVAGVLRYMKNAGITIEQRFFDKVASTALAKNWKELGLIIKFFNKRKAKLNKEEFYTLIEKSMFLENLVGLINILQITPQARTKTPQQVLSMLIAKSNRWKEPPTLPLLLELLEINPGMQSSSSTSSSSKAEQKAVLEYLGRLHSPAPKRKPEEHPDDPRKEGESIKDPKTSSS